MSMLDKLLSHSSIRTKPPVLVDVGASGGLSREWKKLARYSILIGFDADTREMECVEQDKRFLKKHIINKIVAERSGKQAFYLTKSPFCSSLLEPNLEALQSWEFKNLFEIDRIIELEAITLTEALQQAGLDYIDWFKTDSQGTDLRIFKSLSPKIIDNIAVAEFEPGIIDAYKGEDKLYSLMAYMNDQAFWPANINIKGAQRISAKRAEHFFNKIERKALRRGVKPAACWGEIAYFNSFDQFAQKTEREIILGLAFALIKKQYAFAIDLADRAYEHFNSSLYAEVRNYARKRVRAKIWLGSPFYITLKLYRKYLG